MAPAEQQPDSLNIQLLVDSIPALIHTGRPDGYLDYFNKRWLEFFGVTLDKVAGWNWTAVIHPEDVDGIVAKWRACLATGEVFEYETRVRSANGEYRWMFHRKVPLRDANGNIVKWYGSSLDIEDRKRAEALLSAEKRLLEMIATGVALEGILNALCLFIEEQRRSTLASVLLLTPDGVHLCSAAGPSVPNEWKQQMERLPIGPCAGSCGTAAYTRSPVIVSDIATDPLWEVPEHRASALKHGLRASWSSPVLSSNGKVLGTFCMYYREPRSPEAQDLELIESATHLVRIAIERDRAEQALRRSEAYLTGAQKLSHTGSFGCNLSTGEMFWSEETFRIYGYDRSTKPAVERVLQRVHPEDRALFQEHIDQANRDGKDCHVECRLLLPHDSVKHVRIEAHASKDESGNIEFIGAVTDVTATKQAEQDLQRSEAYLAEAQKLSHTGSFGWRPDTGEIVWSDETYRIFEYGRSVKPTIDSVMQRVHPQDLADFQKVIDGASQGATDFEHTYRLLRPDGRVKHVHAIAHAVENASGDREFVGAVSDITERKTTEDKIQRLVDAGILGIFIANLEGEIVEANRAFLQMFQYDRQDLLAGRLRWEDMTPAELRERDQLAVTEALATGFFQPYEKQFFRKDGSRFPVLLGGALFQDSSEGVSFVLDLSEQKRAEEKIREQEAELRQIVDLSPQQVAVFGPGGERLYANRIGLDYVGLSLEEWRQTPGKFFSSRSLIHPDDRARDRDYLDRALSAGSAYELEFRLRKSDGTYRWFLIRFNPLRDDQGKITRWYVALTDIEDRKREEDRLRSENVALREEIDKASMFEEIVGASPALQAVLSRISKVAPSNSTVLITGETGTGKELVARAIHRRSPRAPRPFVSVNCAAIPRELVASELFGHEKGAFTGATQQRLGRFELANGGTIFLDEVGELPAETQVALLRVLQEHEFDRVGGTRPLRADVRVIAATNRDLQAAISAGAFRNDLYYRLNVFPIEIPPLRERKQDISLLVEYFIDRYARKAGKKITTVDKKTLRLLEAYPWPGNIRELQNVIERSIIVCETENFSVDESWLSKDILPPTFRTIQSGAFQVEVEPRSEREIIEAALAETRGRVSGPSGAAAKLRIPPSTLETRIKALEINKGKFRFR
jgi:PAS domain S-box-containing protein